MYKDTYKLQYQMVMPTEFQVGGPVWSWLHKSCPKPLRAINIIHQAEGRNPTSGDCLAAIESQRNKVLKCKYPLRIYLLIPA